MFSEFSERYNISYKLHLIVYFIILNWTIDLQYMDFISFTDVKLLGAVWKIYPKTLIARLGSKREMHNWNEIFLPNVHCACLDWKIKQINIKTKLKNY